MKFGSVPFLARVTPAAPAGGLAIVQSPAQTETVFNTVMQQNLSAIGSGNSLVVVVFSPTSGGAPTMSDSAGGSWGSPAYSYDGAFGVTTRFYTRDNVTSGLTWVRATFGGGVGGFIAVVELSGAGSGLVLDDSDGAAQSSSASWQFPFTSTADDVLFVGTGNLSFGGTPTGVSPVTASASGDDYHIYGYGIFPDAGANIAQINLSPSRDGDKTWAVFRAVS